MCVIFIINTNGYYSDAIKKGISCHKLTLILTFGRHLKSALERLYSQDLSLDSSRLSGVMLHLVVDKLELHMDERTVTEINKQITTLAFMCVCVCPLILNL
jgi:hypothetical protein